MTTAQLSRMKAANARVPRHVCVAELSDAIDEANSVTDKPDASQPLPAALASVAQSHPCTLLHPDRIRQERCKAWHEMSPD